MDGARALPAFAVYFGLVVALAGCSSSKAAPPAVGAIDGGGDAAPPPSDVDGATPTPADSGGADSSDPNPKETACTAAPFVSYAATVSIVDLTGTTQALSGATIGFTTCPGFKITTDATGAASTQLTQGLAVTPLYGDGSSIVSAIGAEIPASAGVTASVTLFASDVAAAIPGFVTDAGEQATLAVVLQADPSATAPCNDVTGVTLAVTDHPEAVVSYAVSGWPSNRGSTTTSSEGPYAFVGGITGTAPVTVTGTKAGCTVSLTSNAQTGRFALLAGAVTIGAATVSN